MRELNPAVAHFVKINPIYGILSLGAINLLVLAVAFPYLRLLYMLLGGKMALASLQLRSLIENEYRTLS